MWFLLSMSLSAMPFLLSMSFSAMPSPGRWSGLGCAAAVLRLLFTLVMSEEEQEEEDEHEEHSAERDFCFLRGCKMDSSSDEESSSSFDCSGFKWVSSSVLSSSSLVLHSFLVFPFSLETGTTSASLGCMGTRNFERKDALLAE